MVDRVELKDAKSGELLHLNPAEISLVKDEKGERTGVLTDDGQHFVVEGRSSEVLKRIQVALDNARPSAASTISTAP
jgi:hypothetical protein